MPVKAGDVCVVTVDIKGSRKLPNRDKVQLRTRQLLKRLNSLYAEKLLAPFEITLGDEFQGVLKVQWIEAVWDIFKLLKNELGVPFYYGVGTGRINTPLARTLTMKPAEMDGEAFHASRKAVKTAKPMRVEFVFMTETYESFIEVNALVRLLLYVANKWTSRQRKVISLLEADPDTTNTEVAKQLGVTKQAISNALTRSGWTEFRDAETALRALLVRSVGGQPQDLHSTWTTRWS